MHVADKVLAERNHKQYTQNAAKQRAHEDAHERCTHLGVLGLKDIQRRQGEDGTRHHTARTGTNALDNHVLTQGTATLGHGAHANGDDGDRYGSLKYLTDFQSKIGCGSREQHCHHDAPSHTPSVDFRVILTAVHQRLIRLTITQLAERVLRQLHLFVVFHFVCLFQYLRRKGNEKAKKGRLLPPLFSFYVESFSIAAIVSL